jgi:hypothetical protein
VGDSTVAIHWDYAREVLQKANGVIATVGLQADLSQETPAPAVEAAAEAQATDQPISDTLTPGALVPESSAPESPAPVAPVPASPTTRDH